MATSTYVLNRAVKKELLPFALVVATLILGGSFWTFTRKTHERSVPLATQAVIQREIRYFEKKISDGSANFQELDALAAIYASQARLSGDAMLYDKAESLALRSLKDMPTGNGGARVVLAQVAQARHQFKEAIQLAQETLEETTNPVGATSTLVTAHLALGELDEAGRQADGLVAMRPGLGTYSLRALVMAAQGREEEALDDFSSAFRVQDYGDEQEAAWVHSMLARFQIKRGHFKEAAAELDHALKLVPSYHLALSLQGELQFRTGKLERAEETYLAAFSNSKQIAYLSALAKTKAVLGKAAASATLLREAEISVRDELKKGSYGHRIELARILLEEAKASAGPDQLAKIKESTELASQEAENRPSSEVLEVQARALWKAGLFHEASIAAQEALRSGVKDPDYYYLSGLIEKSLRHERRSEFWFHRAEELQPGYGKFARETALF